MREDHGVLDEEEIRPEIESTFIKNNFNNPDNKKGSFDTAVWWYPPILFPLHSIFSVLMFDCTSVFFWE